MTAIAFDLGPETLAVERWPDRKRWSLSGGTAAQRHILAWFTSEKAAREGSRLLRALATVLREEA